MKRKTYHFVLYYKSVLVVCLCEKEEEEEETRRTKRARK
jgi:hypothetical protein